MTKVLLYIFISIVLPIISTIRKNKKKVLQQSQSIVDSLETENHKPELEKAIIYSMVINRKYF